MSNIQQIKLESIFRDKPLDWKTELKYRAWRVWEKVSLFHFRHKLKSGYDYFKIGYKSFDFDSSCALEEFVWKLGRVRKCLTRNNFFEGVEEECAKIKRVEELITRVLNDDYFDIFEKPIIEKYGELRHKWMDAKPEDRSVELKHWREKQTPENEEEIRAAEREAYQKAWELREQEWTEAIDIIKNNIFKWWD